MTGVMVVDGPNLLMRSLTASERKGFRAQEGPVDGPALHLFITSLAKHVKRYSPARLVVCWDGGRSAYRMGVWDGYKAKRAVREPGAQQAKDDAYTAAKRFLSLCDIQQWEEPGYEADDLIACLVKRWAAVDQVIVSGDKDMLQLVTDRCIQVKIGSAQEVWDRSLVRDEYGCEPDQIPFLMALTGDSIDGVPGLAGIGPVKARKMMEQADWQWQRVLDDLQPQDRAIVERSLALVDLIHPACHSGLTLISLTPFLHEATYRSLGLKEFLQEYALVKVLGMVASRALWSDRALTWESA